MDPGHSDADSLASVGLTQTWLLSCLIGHGKCKVSGAKYVPSRLLDLQPEGMEVGSFVLLEATKGQSHYSYACLSHRWGGVQPLKLLLNNLDHFKRGMSQSKLPETFRDAAKVCGWMGIRYLWIDSLCIVQDSEIDWIQASTCMGRVFRNSVLTIAATSAANCTSGLFCQRDPFLHKATYLTQGSNDPSEKTPNRRIVVDPWIWQDEVELSAWNCRAWVLQVSSHCIAENVLLIYELGKASVAKDSLLWS